MDRFLIINGDDFGFSPQVNKAIVTAHERGILTSTSLMVSGDAFEEAVTLAKAHPNLGVGLHLVLGCGKSVLSPSQIPHLVDAEGYFPNNPVEAGLRYQFDRKAKQELRSEIRAQLQKFCETGLKLSHVDGHLHHHVNPFVLRTLVELAAEFPIKLIRLPYEELNFTLKIDSRDLFDKAIGFLVFSRLRSYGENLLKTKKINFVDRVYGLLQTGRITEDYLVGLIPQIRSNLVEIYAHPGASELELDALLSKKVKEVLVEAGFELTNYNNLV